MMCLFTRCGSCFFQHTGRMESFTHGWKGFTHSAEPVQVAWNAALTKRVEPGMQRYLRL